MRITRVPVPVSTVENRVLIEITLEEARILRSIAASVVRQPDRVSDFVTEIGRALKGAGVSIDNDLKVETLLTFNKD